MKNLLAEKNGRKFSLALCCLVLLTTVLLLSGVIPSVLTAYGVFAAGVGGIYTAYAGGNVLAKKWGQNGGNGNDKKGGK